MAHELRIHVTIPLDGDTFARAGGDIAVDVVEAKAIARRVMPRIRRGDSTSEFRTKRIQQLQPAARLHPVPEGPAITARRVLHC